jgi:outer membrane protein OmpA-like peptidoglycan-associated protein
MRQLILFIVFAAAIAGVGYVAVTPVDAAYVAPHSGVAERIEAGLRERSAAALGDSGLDWASVEMDGQIAVLRGEAPREEERAAAIAALLGAAGGGGWARGGVVAVRDLSTLAPPISPYEWRAVRSGARVTLAGVTPTRAARAELVAYAGELFAGGVADQMVIARGAPDETAWVAVARAAIAQVATLEDGHATLRDARLTIEGRAPDAVTRDRVTAALAYLPSPFLAAARVESPEVESGVAAAVSASGENFEPIADPEICRDVFATLLREAPVDFADGEPAIAKESYPLLDRLAIAAQRCENAQMAIVGAGDPTNEATAFAELGLRRAQAVADYFILKGVSQDRLTAQSRARDNAPDLAAPAIEIAVTL